MSRRLFCSVAAVGAVLVSWVALGQPGSSRVAAVAPLANRMAPVFRPGIAPVPGGTQGQYELRHLRSRALFTEKGVEVHLPSRTQQGHTLGWSVVGGRVVKPRTDTPREAKLNRLVGPVKSWEREVPTYEGVRYPGVLPGVELWFEERAEGVEYGFRAERGKNLRKVELEYAGAREVRVVEQGRALEVDVGEGVVREQGLQCEQEREDGTKKEVGCRFTRARAVGPQRWAYAIEVDVEDPERPVVVDPLVLWNTYLGGTGSADELRAIQQNDSGELFVAGTINFFTGSLPPVRNKSIGPGGSSDVLVAKFQPDGGLEWWTLIGDTGQDLACCMVIGAAGELYIAGHSNSKQFQWTLPDGTLGDVRANTTEPTDGFVARLDPTGTQLDWYHRIAWNGEELVYALVQGGGHLFVGGKTNATSIPDALPPEFPLMEEEGFIVRLDPSRKVADWTLLIQTNGTQDPNDAVMGLAYKSPGILYATGYYTDDYRPEPTNTFAAFISDVDGDAPTVRSKVGLGRTHNEYGIAVFPMTLNTGNKVVMLGTTTSTDFPGAGQVQGPSDIFVSVLSESDGGILAVEKSRLIGGGGDDALRTVVMAGGSSSRQLYLGGVTTSPNLDVDGGFDTSQQGVDGLVARVRIEADPVLEWMSYVGGSGNDEVLALQVDKRDPGRLYIGGSTTSFDLHYSDNGVDTESSGAGTNDMFLLAVDLNAMPPDVDPGPGPGPGGNPDAQPDPLSPLGWSCGATGSGGGWNALALGVLVGLALLISRRRPRA